MEKITEYWKFRKNMVFAEILHFQHNVMNFWKYKKKIDETTKMFMECEKMTNYRKQTKKLRFQRNMKSVWKKKCILVDIFWSENCNLPNCVSEKCLIKVGLGRIFLIEKNIILS